MHQNGIYTTGLENSQRLFLVSSYAIESDQDFSSGGEVSHNGCLVDMKLAQFLHHIHTKLLLQQKRFMKNIFAFATHSTFLGNEYEDAGIVPKHLP